MGIVSIDDEGHVKTEKIGTRATGTGAKWGTILGAAGGLAAGLLTGGIGLEGPLRELCQRAMDQSGLPIIRATTLMEAAERSALLGQPVAFDA